MSKTIEEQIKVMTHFAKGGEIEFSKGDNTWHSIEEAQWNWSDYDYRIKEQKKIIIIEKWLMQGDMGCYFVLEGSINYFEGYQNIKKVKLLETYKVEL